MEKALLNAIEKKNSPVLQEKEKSPRPKENQLQLYYAQSGDGEYQAQVNAMEGWNQNNQNTNWNQWKIKGVPWRDNPCFRWSDGNQQPPPQHPNPVENQQNWPNRNQEGPNNNSNWSGMNQEGSGFQQNNWGIETRVTGSIGTRINHRTTTFHPTRGIWGTKDHNQVKEIRSKVLNPVSHMQSNRGPLMT